MPRKNPLAREKEQKMTVKNCNTSTPSDTASLKIRRGEEGVTAMSSVVACEWEKKGNTRKEEATKRSTVDHITDTPPLHNTTDRHLTESTDLATTFSPSTSYKSKPVDKKVAREERKKKGMKEKKDNLSAKRSPIKEEREEEESLSVSIPSSTRKESKEPPPPPLTRLSNPTSEQVKQVSLVRSIMPSPSPSWNEAGTNSHCTSHPATSHPTTSALHEKDFSLFSTPATTIIPITTEENTMHDTISVTVVRTERQEEDVTKNRENTDVGKPWPVPNQPCSPSSCTGDASFPYLFSSVLMLCLRWHIHPFLAGEGGGKQELLRFLRHYYFHHWMQNTSLLHQEVPEKVKPTPVGKKGKASSSVRLPGSKQTPKDTKEELTDHHMGEQKEMPWMCFSSSSWIFPLPAVGPQRNEHEMTIPVPIGKTAKQGTAPTALPVVDHVHRVCDLIFRCLQKNTPATDQMAQKSGLSPEESRLHGTEKEEKHTEVSQEEHHKKKDQPHPAQAALDKGEKAFTRTGGDACSSASYTYLLLNHVCDPFTQVLFRLSDRPPSSLTYVLGEVDLITVSITSTFSFIESSHTCSGHSVLSTVETPSSTATTTGTTSSPTAPCIIARGLSSEEVMRLLLTRAVRGAKERAQSTSPAVLTNVSGGTTLAQTTMATTTLESRTTTEKVRRRLLILDAPCPTWSFIWGRGRDMEEEHQNKIEGMEKEEEESARKPQRNAPTCTTRCRHSHQRKRSEKDDPTARSTTCAVTKDDDHRPFLVPHEAALSKSMELSYSISPPASSASPSTIHPSCEVEEEDSLWQGDLLWQHINKWEREGVGTSSSPPMKTEKNPLKEGQGVEEPSFEKEEKVKRMSALLFCEGDTGNGKMSTKASSTTEEQQRQTASTPAILSTSTSTHNIKKDSPEERDSSRTTTLSSFRRGDAAVHPPVERKAHLTATGVTSPRQEEIPNGTTSRSSLLPAPSFSSAVSSCGTPSLFPLQHISGFTIDAAQAARSLTHTRHLLRWYTVEAQREERDLVSSSFRSRFPFFQETPPTSWPTTSLAASGAEKLPPSTSRKRQRSPRVCTTSSHSLEEGGKQKMAEERVEAPHPESTGAAARNYHKEEEKKEKEDAPSDEAVWMHKVWLRFFFHYHRHQQEQLRTTMWGEVRHAANAIAELNMVHKARRERGVEDAFFSKDDDEQEEESEEEEDAPQRTRERETDLRDLFDAPLGVLPIADVLHAATQTQLEARAEEQQYFPLWSTSLPFLAADTPSPSSSFPFALSAPASFPRVPPRPFLTTGGKLTSWRNHLLPSSSSSTCSSFTAGRSHPWRVLSLAEAQAMPRLPVLSDVPFRSTVIPASVTGGPSFPSSSCFPASGVRKGSTTDLSPPPPDSVPNGQPSLLPLPPSPLFGSYYGAVGHGEVVEGIRKDTTCTVSPHADGEEKNEASCRRRRTTYPSSVRLWCDTPLSTFEPPEERTMKRDGSPSPLVSQRIPRAASFPSVSLVVNSCEELRYFVHRRFMPRRMRESVDRDCTRVAGRCGGACGRGTPDPFHTTSSSCRRRLQGGREGELEEEKEEEEEEEESGRTTRRKTRRRKESDGADEEGREEAEPRTGFPASSSGNEEISPCSSHGKGKESHSQSGSEGTRKHRNAPATIFPIPMPEVEWSYH